VPADLIESLPLGSEKKAILAPSGDQTGEKSVSARDVTGMRDLKHAENALRDADYEWAAFAA
jgi:hypothetical protein